MERDELEQWGREALVARAETLDIPRARLLTREELVEAIEAIEAITKGRAVGGMEPSSTSRPSESPPSRMRSSAPPSSRGFLGRARDLLARVVEKGLHLPDAVERFRGAPEGALLPSDDAPLPTLTLAQIYAAQGHLAKAVGILEGVLDREPEHDEARALLAALQDRANGELAAVSSRQTREGRESTDESAAMSMDVEKMTVDERTPGEEEDVCLAVDTPAGEVFVLWQLAERMRAHVAETHGALDPFLRIFIVEPSLDGPRSSMRDVSLSELRGEMRLTDLPRGAVIRVAAGYGQGESFRPVCHAPALERSTDDARELAVTDLLRRTARGVERVLPSDDDAPLLAYFLGRWRIDCGRDGGGALERHV